MDTHITHLDPEPLLHRSARLPDEPDLEGASHSSDEPTPEASPEVTPSPGVRKRRGRLLTGVAMGALVVITSGVLLLSPMNTIVPIPSSVTLLAAQVKQSITTLSVPTQIAALTDSTKTAILGSVPEGDSSHATEPGATPSGSAVSSPQRSRVVAQAGALVAPAASLAATRVPRRPESISTPPYAGQPREQNLNELLKLRPDTEAPAHDQQQPQSASTPTVVVVNPQVVTQPNRLASVAAVPSNDAQEPGGQVPISETGNPPKPAQLDITSAVTEAALGQPATAVIPPSNLVTAPAVVSTPSEVKPVLVASQSAVVPDIKANAAATKAPVLFLSVPPGHQEQAEVLQFVTGLSGEIARLRTENETFRKDIARRVAEQDGRMSDFNRRVSIAEARAALRSASDAGKSDEPQAEPSSRAPTPSSVTLVSQGAAVRPSPLPQSAAARPRYHVQAASPGLALLAEIGRGGGEGAQLQVAVGDQVPGYGVVKSVAQRGPNWVVQTERGPID